MVQTQEAGYSTCLRSQRGIIATPWISIPLWSETLRNPSLSRDFGRVTLNPEVTPTRHKGG